MMPIEVNDLVWYGFTVLFAWFLWTLRQSQKETTTEIRGLRADMKGERDSRENLALKVATLEARCLERQAAGHNCGSL